jgi:hypothetical protein
MLNSCKKKIKTLFRRKQFGGKIPERMQKDVHAAVQGTVSQKSCRDKDMGHKSRPYN